MPAIRRLGTVFHFRIILSGATLEMATMLLGDDEGSSRKE
jgi:hypothetical protein